MQSLSAFVLSCLAFVATGVRADGAAGHPSTADSFLYTTPAMYLWLEVKKVEVLGNLSSGGLQLLGPIVAGQLVSEPGFEPQFNGSVKYAGDYLTQDPFDGIARPACVGAIYPDDNDSPFLFRISGVDHASEKAVEIFTSSQDLNLSIPYGYSYSVWTPTFFGGSPKYSNLQNSVFVASETVASSDRAGYFLVGMKISKIWPKNTTVTIGNEFVG